MARSTEALEKELSCPECRQPLVPGRAPDGPSFAYCPPCGGCWLDAPGVVELTGAEPPLTEASAVAPIACPRCGVWLVSVYPDSEETLTVDLCPGCHGLWLDRGELERLRALARDGEPPRAGWAALARIARQLEDGLRHLGMG